MLLFIMVSCFKYVISYKPIRKIILYILNYDETGEHDDSSKKNSHYFFDGRGFIRR
ncbi:hypothetical protein W03_23500 [Nitrosomonas sp. PY1]|nr:hypothetical protein W03_23500 [Nitrosomonas sp. PY1]